MPNKYSLPAKASYRPLNLGVIGELAAAKDAEYKGVLGKAYEAGDNLNFKTGMLTENWAKPMQEEYQNEILEATNLLKTSGNPTLAAEKLAQIQNKLSKDERVRLMELDAQMTPQMWDTIQKNQSGYFDWMDAQTGKVRGLQLPQYGQELNPDDLYNTYSRWAPGIDFVKDYGQTFRAMDPEDILVAKTYNPAEGTVTTTTGEIRNVYDWLVEQDTKGGKSLTDFLIQEFEHQSTGTARNYKLNNRFGQTDPERFDRFLNDFLQSIQVFNSEEYKDVTRSLPTGSGSDGGGGGSNVGGVNQFTSTTMNNYHTDLKDSQFAYLESKTALKKVRDKVESGELSPDSPEYNNARTNYHYYQLLHDQFNNSKIGKDIAKAEREYYTAIPDAKRVITVDSPDGAKSINLTPEQIQGTTDLLMEKGLVELFEALNSASSAETAVMLSQAWYSGMNNKLKQITGDDKAEVILKNPFKLNWGDALTAILPMMKTVGSANTALDFFGTIVDLEAMGIADHAKFQGNLMDQKEKAFKESASDFGTEMTITQPIGLKDKDTWSAAIAQSLSSKAFDDVVIHSEGKPHHIKQEDAYQLLDEIGKFVNSSKFDPTKGFGLADNNEGGALFFSGLPLVFKDGKLRPTEEGEGGSMSILLNVNRDAIITDQATPLRTLIGMFNLTLQDTGKIVPGVFPGPDASRAISSHITSNQFMDAALRNVAPEAENSPINQKDNISQTMNDMQVAFQGTELSGAKFKLNPKYEESPFLQFQGTTWGVPNTDGTKKVQPGIIVRYGDSSENAKAYSLADNLETLSQNDPTANLAELGEDYVSRMLGQYRTANLLSPTSYKSLESKLINNTLTVGDVLTAVGYSEGFKDRRRNDLNTPFAFKDKHEAFLFITEAEYQMPEPLKLDANGIPEGTVPMQGLVKGTIDKQVSLPYVHSSISKGVQSFSNDYPNVVYTSAARSKATNSDLPEAAENSKHLTGKAIDLRYGNNDDAKRAYQEYQKNPEGFKQKYGIVKFFPHTVQAANQTHYHIEFL